MFHVKHLQSVERAARTTLVKSRRDHRPLAVALPTEPASVFLSLLAAVRSWQSPPLAIRSFVHRRGMFHVKHLRSVEAAGGTTRVKSHRNRRPRALAMLPEPVGVLPPSRTTVRSWQSPSRANRGFVDRRRLFHVKHPQSVERAARTTLVKSRRDHRPLAVALQTEPASVFLSLLAAVRSWQSPPLAIRSFVHRRGMFHVKHLRSVEAAGGTTRVKSHRNRPPRALAMLPEPVGVLPPSRATVRSWQSPCRAIRGLVGWRRMFRVKHPRSAEEAAGSTRVTPRRGQRPPRNCADGVTRHSSPAVSSDHSESAIPVLDISQFR